MPFFGEPVYQGQLNSAVVVRQGGVTNAAAVTLNISHLQPRARQVLIETTEPIRVLAQRLAAVDAANKLNAVPQQVVTGKAFALPMKAGWKPGEFQRGDAIRITSGGTVLFVGYVETVVVAGNINRAVAPPDQSPNTLLYPNGCIMVNAPYGAMNILSAVLNDQIEVAPAAISAASATVADGELVDPAVYPGGVVRVLRSGTQAISVIATTSSNADVTIRELWTPDLRVP